MEQVIEFLLEILGNWGAIAGAGLLVVAKGTAFLAAIYAFFLLIPGEQPDKFIKKILDFTEKYSKK